MNKLKNFLVAFGILLFVLSTYFVVKGTNDDTCVEVTENMTIKKANEIAEICNKEISYLQSQHDILSEQQGKIKEAADARRELLNKNPLSTKVEVNEGIVKTSKYIHQHLNPLPTVGGDTPKERFENLVTHYGNVEPSVFVEAGREYGIAEELLACIAYAETHIGTHLKAKNNIMNYGNNDRGAKVPYDTVLNNVRAAAHGLKHGTYLSHNKKLGELSNGGRTALGLPTCENKGVYCYATSGVNWRGNVNDCMSFIHGENKDWDNYLF